MNEYEQGVSLRETIDSTIREMEEREKTASKRPELSEVTKSLQKVLGEMHDAIKANETNGGGSIAKRKLPAWQAAVNFAHAFISSFFECSRVDKIRKDYEDCLNSETCSGNWAPQEKEKAGEIVLLATAYLADNCSFTHV